MSSLIPVYTQVYKEPVAFQKALGYAFEGLVNAGVSFDALPAWKAIEKRVGEGIYMGSGLLLPHTRIQGLKSPLMAFAVAPEIQGIAVPQNEVAQFLCLLLSPQEKPGRQLQTARRRYTTTRQTERPAAGSGSDQRFFS